MTEKEMFEFVNWIQKWYHPALNSWTHRDPIAIEIVEKLLYTTEELYKIYKDEPTRSKT